MKTVEQYIQEAIDSEVMDERGFDRFATKRIKEVVFEATLVAGDEIFENLPDSTRYAVYGAARGICRYINRIRQEMAEIDRQVTRDGCPAVERAFEKDKERYG